MVIHPCHASNTETKLLPFKHDVTSAHLNFPFHEISMRIISNPPTRRLHLMQCRRPRLSALAEDLVPEGVERPNWWDCEGVCGVTVPHFLLSWQEQGHRFANLDLAVAEALEDSSVDTSHCRLSTKAPSNVGFNR